jgi:hypothetical protein
MAVRDGCGNNPPPAFSLPYDRTTHVQGGTMRSLERSLALGAAALVLASPPASAALLKPMNLEELTLKAGRIFSGTVVAVEKGHTVIGGGRLPTLTYRIALDRALAGAAGIPGRDVVEVRMIGDLAEIRRGRLVRLPKTPPRPQIEAGRRYLFFLTMPGPTGLSTTVGLGQGLFRITGDAGDEGVVNEYDNAGLFRGLGAKDTPQRGPVRYADVAARVAALRGRQ